MDDMPFLNELNTQQRQVCIDEGNILLKACPGSGKTRTLTYKLAYLVEKYIASQKLNIAITYTNRAADEIKERLERIEISENKVWVGTIHQFCLEFIIRPYTMYHKRLRKGYHIIDEYVMKQYIEEIIEELGIDIGYSKPFEYPEILEKYQKKLLDEKEIDFNDILSISFDLISDKKFIAENISGIIRTILVDEYQDTNELQYKILSSIVRADKKIQVTFVGDTDQAIYGGLGGVAKTCDELQKEFGVKFLERKLDGCYRSTQRIVDYYSYFQLKGMKIQAVSDIKDEIGCLIYDNTINKSELFEKIACIVKDELSKGIPETEICIIAPQWWLLFPLSKKMKDLLPNVKFDAPDITPIKYDPMNIFYLISKLLFTESGIRITSRKRVANEIIEILTEEYKIRLSEQIDSYRVLKVINSIYPTNENGIAYLQEAITKFLVGIGIELSIEASLYKAYEDFMERIKDRVKNNHLSTDIDVFRQCFKEKEGVVINTFHGVKGEEYTTVIAFGILKGYIPHWDIIINKPIDYQKNETKKLLYVVCSRAKKNLFLFSEQGRTTQKGAPLLSTDEILEIDYEYDSLEVN
ncbi:ATP-dependent helicase [Enterocloster clostridioformis]|uniref:ATP-dependent helicase n=1 Tax=Enterocloster clostridioformis TaxID=1531 RepID=UPI0008E719B4|nr:ATP-dependent helicase [Enterocloster clostridioformis]SFG20224.1 Superfamily I DNA or RNA helicase [Enterocloster clostridioformis]